MPQFDFYIFQNFTIFFAALVAFVIFIIVFYTALVAWTAAQVRLLVKANLTRMTLEFARSAQLFVAGDLLEQFVLPRIAPLALIALASSLVIAAVFTALPIFAQAVSNFVGTVGSDIYSEAAVKFSRSWLNFSAIFFCVLCFNLFGILPFSFTITGSLAAPFCLSLTMFFVCAYTALSRGGFSAAAGFLPGGTERAIAPLVILIEVVSNLAKFISLGIRLFANMFAGHLLLKVFYSICFQLLTAINLFLVVPEIFTGMFVFFIIALEIMIAFLQAFVFVLLSILYLKESENFIVLH